MLKGKSPVVSLMTGENRIKFEQDVYLFISSSGVMLSPDGKKFAPIHKMKALKKLFGMDKGSLSIGFGISKETGPEIRVAFDSK